MTGYGLATLEKDSYSLVVEVKALNSKFLDANLKLPKKFADKEIEVRRMVGEVLERGKIALNIEFKKISQEGSRIKIDKELFREYFFQLQKLALEVGAHSLDEIFKLAIHSPQVLGIGQELNNEEIEIEWEEVSGLILIALRDCDAFRLKEGEGLKINMEKDIHSIKSFLSEIAVHDPRRTEAVKQRLMEHISQYKSSAEVDQNRFEQELIFYIEKLDINEEKVRLESHLDYFLEVINEGNSQGKKLGFIGQEMGREINTIGSKANDAAIQRLVVGMKEDLEKIKEQLLNIL